MTAFGPMLRAARLHAGLGLRTFAGLIDQRASVVSAIESLRLAPWRRKDNLARVADVLGLAENSVAWQEMVELAHRPNAHDETEPHVSAEGTLAWWLQTDVAPALDQTEREALAKFVGAKVASSPSKDEDSALPDLPALTDLAIEWRVRRLLGQRMSHISAAPVDIELALECEANVKLEMVPGLIPRFSVQACVVRTAAGLTLLVDRILADSRPLASYRYLLARCFAPAALWDFVASPSLPTDWFVRLQAADSWRQAQRDCKRFALVMQLPAGPVLAGAETAYRELVEQQGWVDAEEAIRAIRNRLAEQFAVPPAVVHRRLVGWPCHLYGRIAQALAAEEATLPPVDWIAPEEQPRQQSFFDAGVWQDA